MSETDPKVDPKDLPEEPTEEPKEEKPFLAFASKQEHDEYVERTLKDRLERKDRKLAEEKEATERAAREKALEEQGEFKSVSEDRQQTIVERDATISEKDTRIAELEADLEAMKPHRESNEARAKELMENVPESVKKLLAPLDPLEQLEWLDENPELAGISAVTARPKGSRPTGKARSDKTEEPNEQAINRQRQTTSSAF